MSPRHHDGEKVTYQPASPSWVDEAIAEARARGEFDDLPGQGQPLRLVENPLAGEWEMAFHLLENAGMAPPWMEMSREIRAGLAELAEARQRAVRHRQGGLARIAAADTTTPTGAAPRPRYWWWPFRRQRPEPRGDDERGAGLAGLEAERCWARRDYLERAARLDELIAAYNAWLPDTLRRLQKPRLPASRAAREFDAACPPITADQ